MSSNAAVGLLARMLFGLSQTAARVDGTAPDFGADFMPYGDHAVAATITVETGDQYRVTVEWLKEESP